MRIAALFFAPLLLSATVALADDAPAGKSGPAGSAGSTESSVPNDSSAPGNPGVAPSNPAVPNAAPSIEPSDPAISPETAKVMAEMNRVRQRAVQVDPKEKEATDKSLRETALEVDAATAKREKVEVAGRLAAQFGGIPELYAGEHDRLKSGWGEIAIAHTLLANAKTSLTIDQLFDLRQEKLGWGQIAHGLDVNLGEFVKVAQSQGHAAVGAPKGSVTGEQAQVQAKADVPSTAKRAAKSASVKSGGKATK